MESELRVTCVCLRQLDTHPSCKKGRQNADEQMCLFNTFLPALWVSEQHLHPAKAAAVCASQLLLADVQRKHGAPTRDSWALHTPQRDRGEATPKEHRGVPRLLAAHQTNYRQVSSVGGRAAWWSRWAQWEPQNSSRDLSVQGCPGERWHTKRIKEWNTSAYPFKRTPFRFNFTWESFLRRKQGKTLLGNTWFHFQRKAPYIAEQNLEFKKASIWHLREDLIISLYAYKLWHTFMMYLFFPNLPLIQHKILIQLAAI